MTGQRLTLAQAVALPPTAWEDLSATEDLHISADDSDRAAAVWAWLVGVPAGHANAHRVRQEAVSDGPLTLALLGLPAVEFLRWFKAADWTEFDSSERTGSEAWAIEVMQRAWGGVRSPGGTGTTGALARSHQGLI